MSEVLDTETEKRFWAKVDKTETCWLWTDKISNPGYGRFGAKKIGHQERRNHYAHRLSYEMAVGPIPPGLRIDHRCHVANCVNPKHLRLATAKQNAENMLGASKASRSGVRGVWRGREGRWTGQVTHNGVRYSIPSYSELADAEAAIVALRLRLYTHNDRDRIEKAA